MPSYTFIKLGGQLTEWDIWFWSDSWVCLNTILPICSASYASFKPAQATGAEGGTVKLKVSQTQLSEELPLPVLCVQKKFGKRFYRGFCSLSPHFVVFIHGERDLSSLPCLGGAAVQISLKIEGYCVADLISSIKTQILERSSHQKNLQHRVCVHSHL